jgi:hypothetical protein
MRPAERLWTQAAARIEQAGITRFRRWLDKERGLRFDDYESLWRWSTTEIEAFWAALWEYTEISWAALASQVGALAATLKRLGIAPGDRVVSYLSNIPETVAALLGGGEPRRSLVELLAGHGDRERRRSLPPDRSQSAPPHTRLLLEAEQLASLRE